MIRVGTAGWSIPRPSANALPGDGTHLERYARVLNCAEINSSFYRSHSARTYAGWGAQTPRTFRFAIKVPGRITHEGRLRRARVPLLQFRDEVGGLGRRLGPWLVQLPPSLAFERRVARAFFGLLRDLHDGPVVCEPRHASWFTDRADALLDRHRIARVAADPSPNPGAGAPGGWPGIVYYRLHGSPRRYWSVYERARLQAWADGLRRPRGIDAWCVFDNTAGGGAVPNALELLGLVRPRL
jgi:uncharacterized protein YecE (DUF72 family)